MLCPRFRLGWYFSVAAVLAGCAGDAAHVSGHGVSGGAAGQGTSAGGSGGDASGRTGVGNRAGSGGGSGSSAGAGKGATTGEAGTAGQGVGAAGIAGGASGAAGASGGRNGAGRGGSGTAGAGASGGPDAGGDGAGGSSAGSAGMGGPCVESTCGSHKWACWRMPNPASSPASVPNHQSYTDLGNGAVRDDITCLVWEKANPATEGTWQESVDRCAGLAATSYAGFDDWRLPTRVEMASISDVTRGSKGYPSVFTVTSGYYATGSWWYETITGQNTSGFAWAYGTNGYTSNAVVMTDPDNVARCVRGNGSGEAADELAVEPLDHYTLEGATGSTEVTDNYTGLVWQQGFSPAIMAWEDAPAYCAGLSLNGHTGFRVPTLNELASTVNEAKVGGAINTAAFPVNPNGCKEPKYWFWAAEASKVGGTAWGLSYCDGFTGWNVGASGDWNYFPEANVRCVR